MARSLWSHHELRYLWGNGSLSGPKSRAVSLDCPESAFATVLQAVLDGVPLTGRQCLRSGFKVPPAQAPREAIIKDLENPNLLKSGG